MQEEVDKIAELTGLSQVEVMRQMVRAGCAAIKENGYKLSLPLKLEVQEEAQKKSRSTYPANLPHGSALNENHPKKK